MLRRGASWKLKVCTSSRKDLPTCTSSPFLWRIIRSFIEILPYRFSNDYAGCGERLVLLCTYEYTVLQHTWPEISSSSWKRLYFRKKSFIYDNEFEQSDVDKRGLVLSHKDLGALYSRRKEHAYLYFKSIMGGDTAFKKKFSVQAKDPKFFIRYDTQIPYS
jgi:hypothetical protein